MYYAETGKASKTELHFEVVYDVVRHERVVLGRAIPRLSEFQLDKKMLTRPGPGCVGTCDRIARRVSG